MARVYKFVLQGINANNNSEWQSQMHFQTDVPVAQNEPSPGTVLDIILDHFSTSGHDIAKWRATTWNSVSFTRASVIERLAPGSTDVPVSAEEVLALGGTQTAQGNDILPSAVAPWYKFTTGVALRSARGGTHGPPAIYAPLLGADGRWEATGVWWTAVNALADSMKDAMEDVFATTGDINPVVYSERRRELGASPYVFAIEDAKPVQQVRWLRRRMS
jgi:hypothetical protein